MADPTPRLEILRSNLGYDSLGNAPHLLCPNDKIAIESGDYKRVGGEALCTCGLPYNLHPPVQGALYLTRSCQGLVKL
jgi:hypothetical protein